MVYRRHIIEEHVVDGVFDEKLTKLDERLYTIVAKGWIDKPLLDGDRGDASVLLRAARELQKHLETDWHQGNNKTQFLHLCLYAIHDESLLIVPDDVAVTLKAAATHELPLLVHPRSVEFARQFCRQYQQPSVRVFSCLFAAKDLVETDTTLALHLLELYAKISTDEKSNRVDSAMCARVWLTCATSVARTLSTSDSAQLRIDFCQTLVENKTLESFLQRARYHKLNTIPAGISVCSITLALTRRHVLAQHAAEEWAKEAVKTCVGVLLKWAHKFRKLGRSLADSIPQWSYAALAVLKVRLILPLCVSQSMT